MRRALAWLARGIRANAWEIVGAASGYAVFAVTGWIWTVFGAVLVLTCSSYASGLFAGARLASALHEPPAPEPEPGPRPITVIDRANADLADRRMLWEIEDAFNQGHHA